MSAKPELFKRHLGVVDEWITAGNQESFDAVKMLPKNFPWQDRRSDSENCVPLYITHDQEYTSVQTKREGPLSSKLAVADRELLAICFFSSLQELG